MTPGNLLSDSEHEAANNNNNEYIYSKNSTAMEHIQLNETNTTKIIEKTIIDVHNPTTEFSKKLSKTKSQKCSKIPLKTTRCNVAVPLKYSCMTNQGHRVERTSCGNHLYCRTHSLFTNCVLNPCSSDPLPFSKDKSFRTNHSHKPSVLKNFSRKQLFVLISLAVGDFISSCSMSIMAPFFPKEATEKGMGVSVSGFVFSFYALVMFIMSPIVGKILPRAGAKTLFIMGLFLAGFSNLIFGFLPIIDDYNYFTAACFLIRGLEAVGAGAFSTASFVFVVEIFPENISTVLGILETFIGLGMSVGPAIGGILYSVGGFSLPFLVLGISMLLVVPINFWFLPSICSTSKNSHGSSFWKILKIPSVFVIGLIVVMSSNIWSFLDPTLEPHLRQLSLTSEEIGLVFLLFSSMYGAFSLIWGWLADKVGNHWSMMVTGQFCSVACLMALGPSPIMTHTANTLWKNLLALSLLGISVALTLMPTFQALLQAAVQNGHKRELTTYSIIAGCWSCMYSLGEVLGPTVGGVLLDKYGFPVCSTVMAAGTLMVLYDKYGFPVCSTVVATGTLMVLYNKYGFPVCSTVVAAGTLIVGLGSLIFFSLQSIYTSEESFNEEKKPLVKKQDKRAYYTDLAGDSCVIFVPTARSP